MNKKIIIAALVSFFIFMVVAIVGTYQKLFPPFNSVNKTTDKILNAVNSTNSTASDKTSNDIVPAHSTHGEKAMIEAMTANLKVVVSLAEIRGFAEGYYDVQDPKSFGTALTAATCPTSGTSMFQTKKEIRDRIAAAAQAGEGGIMGTRCATDGNDYAISVKMKSDGASFWCIDSTGAAGVIRMNTWTGVTCPRI